MQSYKWENSYYHLNTDTSYQLKVKVNDTIESIEYISLMKARTLVEAYIIPSHSNKEIINLYQTKIN